MKVSRDLVRFRMIWFPLFVKWKIPTRCEVKMGFLWREI
jgi:hypothetical protein